MTMPKREATALLTALAAGVVPRAGLRHIAVGRLREVAALRQDFDHLREGGATVRFVVGRFGSGKSFLIQLARAYALESKFLVADCDFTPDRRLQGTGGQALATYRELMRNLATQTRPDGNALPVVIERWISTVQTEVSTRQGLTPGSSGFDQAVETQIMATISAMTEVVHGFDFGTVINAYYRGYSDGNDTLKGNALRWLRGEFQTKTEARDALGVRSIIDDENFYDYLKAIARFAKHVGYNGFLVCFDEAVNLYKITNSTARNSNYEKILSIVNDCLQGRATYIGFIFGGTNEFLEDQRRGLFSYEALRTRLSASRFVTDDLRDFSSPVLSLPPLTSEEVYVLLQKVAAIHRQHVTSSRGLDDSAIITFMEESLRRAGAQEFTTPRDIVRELVNLLNLLVQYPEKTWQDLVGIAVTNGASQHQQDNATSSAEEASDPLDRFTDFRVG